MLLSVDRHNGYKDVFSFHYRKDGQFSSSNKSTNNIFLIILF